MEMYHLFLFSLYAKIVQSTNHYLSHIHPVTFHIQVQDKHRAHRGSDHLDIVNSIIPIPGCVLTLLVTVSAKVAVVCGHVRFAFGRIHFLISYRYHVIPGSSSLPSAHPGLMKWCPHRRM
jgi:hypothetical protein